IRSAPANLKCCASWPKVSRTRPSGPNSSFRSAPSNGTSTASTTNSMSATEPRLSPALGSVICSNRLNAATESGRGGLRRAEQPDDQKNRSDQEVDNIIRRQILAPCHSVGLDDLRDYIRGDEPANPQEQIDHAKDLAESARRGV